MSISRFAVTAASFAAIFVVGLGSASAQYGEYGSAGCGLGSMLITDDGFVQIFAATTNHFTGTQTMGITSGTSNCTDQGLVKVDKEQEAFVEANFERLQSDIAAGGGPYLDALTELMGCQGVGDAVGAMAQTRYEVLFSRVDTTPQTALYGLKGAMSTDESLARACTRL